MDLQNIFYILAIIYLCLGILFLFTLFFLILWIKKSINNYKNNVVNKALSLVKGKKEEIIVSAFVALSSFIMNKLKNKSNSSKAKKNTSDSS